MLTTVFFNNPLLSPYTNQDNCPSCETPIRQNTGNDRNKSKNWNVMLKAKYLPAMNTRFQWLCELVRPGKKSKNSWISDTFIHAVWSIYCSQWISLWSSNNPEHNQLPNAKRIWWGERISINWWQQRRKQYTFGIYTEKL